MGTSFTHLHLHSQYSLLDGAIRLKDLYPRLHEYGMNSVALTDHGNMFGALDFYKGARAAEIKPIFGVETYVCPDMTQKEKGQRANHLVLLARNLEGYQNLTYLVSKSYLEGFYYTGRIDKKLLRERSGGLIGMSACLSGEVPSAVLTKGIRGAVEVAKEYADIFDDGCFFMEIQPNGMDEQEEVNEGLIKVAAQTGIGLVATNDCHYLDRKDAKAHDVLMCVQTGKCVDDENRLKHEVDEFYLKSPAEMEQAFAHVPESLENAARIADMCNVELDLTNIFLPKYQVPEEHSLATYLEHTAHKGLEHRFAEMEERGETPDKEVYEARLKRELGVINTMDFPGYFLIVWDFINYAKEHGIPVGPGRGSGAGSLVAYSLRITDLDPLPYDLLFERFLNPERVSMPDFDIDFCMYRRDEVIKYVTEKYGEKNVGQIATFHSLKAKGVVRDVARAMGMAYADGDKVSKLIPEPIAGKSVSIPQAMEQEPKLREMAQEDEKIAELLDVAAGLEGLNRHAGMHAAGVVIGEKPLWNYAPCFRGQNGEIVTQYAKNEVEDVGLVKFDFLGLKTLTILSIAEQLVQQTDPEFILDQIPLDDPETYELIAAGDTTAVFQLESEKFKEVLRQLKPDCFEDIIAAVALYRPGPLGGGMVDDFILRKHGKKKVVYDHPWLEDILKETYGVIVYQEQVMQIASALGGFSLGQADILRRAMGKKKESEMEKQKAHFLAGAKEKEVDLKVAEGIFDTMAFFAGYGFNKSHSASYALITVQTAWMKRHWPVEFMAAVLTCDKENSDNMVKFLAETREMGIKVSKPNVNESDTNFSVVEREGKKRIRFGLSAVRNVGEGAVEAIIAARQEKPFTGLFDFCERVDAKKVNRRVLEALIKSGAFDSLSWKRGISRARLTAALDAAHERAAAAQRDRERGQTNIFDILDESDGRTAEEEDAEKYPDVPEWDPRVMLAYERENLGFFVSGHPLDSFEQDLQKHATASIADVLAATKRREVTIGGLVATCTVRPLKSGKGHMASLNLEDKTGHVEVVAWSKTFEQYEEVIRSDEPLLVTANVEVDYDGEARKVRCIMRSAVTLPELRDEQTAGVSLRFRHEQLNPELVEQLKEMLGQHQGECPVFIELILPEHSTTRLALGDAYQVQPTDALMARLERAFGKGVAVLR